MFGKRLAALRKIKGISQYDLADQLGLSRGQLSNYELGTREPDFETLRKITEYFDVTADYLLGISDNPKETGPVSTLPPIQNNKLPILGIVKSGLPLLAEENIVGYLDVPDDIQADYAVIVKNNSVIEVAILEGDYAICREAAIAEPGQISVVLREIADGDCEATLKYCLGKNQRFTQGSANPNNRDTNSTEEHRIIGLFVALIRKEIPVNQAYQDSMKIYENEDWIEIIDLSSQAGLKAHQVKEILIGQIEIVKRLKDM